LTVSLYTFGLLWLGTVDNHGNTEITETVIFVKCCECHDFAKMPCFCRVFSQNAVVLRFHKNIVFSISIIWSLLCEFNAKNIYLSFASAAKVRVLCYLLAEYVTVTSS